MFSRSGILLVLLGMAAGTALQAQSLGGSRSENPEDFRIEVTGSAWLVNSRGHIQADGSPIDFVSDLRVNQKQPTFFGQLVFKPGRKHRIVVEGNPFQIQGLNTIDRNFTYQGQSFSISQTIRSSADLNYVFAGYQYDVLSGPKGHLGFSVGGAYLGATGSVLAVQQNTLGTRTETIGLPLAGFDFRLFPIPHHRIVEIQGGMRGMSFGGYGYYVGSTGSAGLCLGPITFLAGYRAVNTDLHESSGANNGIVARLQGPIFSGMFRW